MYKKMKKSTFGILSTVSLLAIGAIGIGLSDFVFHYEDDKKTENGFVISVPGGEGDIVLADLALVSEPLSLEPSFDDHTGRVTIGGENGENLAVKLTGKAISYADFWKTEVIFGLVENDEILSSLIADGYLVAPAFAPLTRYSDTKDIELNDNGSFWAAKDVASDGSRRFSMAASLNWGSMFANMNPSEFFDSEISNGFKRGIDYTDAEIKGMIGRLADLNGKTFSVSIVPTALTSTSFDFHFLNNGLEMEINDQEILSSVTNVSFETLTTNGITLPDLEPNLSNFEFSGWAVSPTAAEENLHLPGEKITSADLGEFGDDIYLYANYIGAPIDVTYSLETDATYNDPNDTGIRHQRYLDQIYGLDDLNASIKDYYTLDVWEFTFKGVSGKDKTINISPDDEINTIMNPTLDINRGEVGAMSLKANYVRTADVTYVIGDYGAEGSPATYTINQKVDVDTALSYEEAGFSSHVDHGFVNWLLNGETAVKAGDKLSPTLIPEGTTQITLVAQYADIVDVVYETGTTAKPAGETVEVRFTLDGGSLTAKPIDFGWTSADSKNPDFDKWVSTITSTKTYDSGATISSGDLSAIVDPTDGKIHLTPTFTKNGCFVPDSLITLANGQMKRAEDIQVGDSLLTWDFETGRYEEQPAIIVVKDENMNYDRLDIRLDNGQTISVADIQSFFDYEKREYFDVTLETIETSIGRKIAMQSEDGSLKSQEIVAIDAKSEQGTVYDIVTADNWNHFLNGALTVVSVVLNTNLFEVSEDFAYDSIKYQKDIEQYGLYTVADFEGLLSEMEYYLFRVDILKVGVGKGILSWDEILQAIDVFVNPLN